jgi:hypothetical protein
LKSIGIVSFEAKAMNDIHVSFNTVLTRVRGQDGLEDSPVYELVIGGWLNTKTAIRKKGQPQL